MTPISKNDLIQSMIQFTKEAKENHVAEDLALRPELSGMTMYVEPLLAVAAAEDPLFAQLQAPEAIGPHFMLPESWLPGAKSVLSFFSPFTDQVIEANLREPTEVPAEWLHARIEGQIFISAMTTHIRDLVTGAGYECVIPPMDKRFWGNGSPARVNEDGSSVPGFTSNWSERHIAYVCGLGTFGLSRGLITPRGMAGRFGSLVTTMPIEADQRPYNRYDEYCVKCGACIRQCPAKAITLEEGKAQIPCSAFCDEVRTKHTPRYGCGKCSVGVPCTRGIPKPGK
jgi:epoxyqueuosine reductase QueG